MIWLLRHQKPDFKTIADFRRDNRDAFRAVFRQFVLLGREMDLFGRYWRVGKKFPTCLEGPWPCRGVGRNWCSGISSGARLSLQAARSMH